MDNGPAKILQISANIIAPSLTAIFNLSVNLCTYIDAWKKARITPIFNLFFLGFFKQSFVRKPYHQRWSSNKKEIIIYIKY
jgi:hypothetical protein